MNCFKDKLACKLIGVLLSIFMLGMLLILFSHVDQSRIASWITLIAVILSLVALNIIYLKLIGSVFRKLNHEYR
ncbi:hypothetical protein QQ008_08175 [Fulvivirgaceae bacterium BMA10]|uniref:Uncharacterized protein n=1 Tax=Splendidivirga corallicola TaxID=3051826 RepID=A0ABT8KKT9_9BACT|nr:hypothetical protein [Fulvivirgaceae bacterium BMA10]